MWIKVVGCRTYWEMGFCNCREDDIADNHSLLCDYKMMKIIAMRRAASKDTDSKDSGVSARYKDVTK